jgi:hypothetical protein
MSEIKAKYMKVNGNIMSFEQNFRYLGTLINSKTVKREETKSRIAAGSRSVQP